MIRRIFGAVVVAMFVFSGTLIEAQADQGPSTPSLAIGLYRPEFPDRLSALDAYEQEGASHMALVHWYALWGGWKSAFNAADLEVVRRRGSLPMITWEPWAGTPADPAWSLNARILSGASDVYIRSWARGLAAYGGPVMLRFAHEMHDQSYPWAVGVNGNTAEQYVTAWRHVHAVFAEEGASNVRWIWNPNTMPGTQRAAYEGLYRSVYPGSDVVDWAGLDIYNGGSALNGWGGWRTFGEALGDPYDALRAVADRPILLAEVGSAETGGAKAQWIRFAFAELQSSRFAAVRALVWLDVDKKERWDLHSSQPAFAAWLGGLRATGLQVERDG
jgi:beta-mannanase